LKLLHLLKEAALAVFDNVFYLISFFVHKNNNIWAFGSMFGTRYADNSKYFFEYVCKHHPEIRAIWFSANPEVVLSLRSKGYEAYRFYAPKGILLALRARVGFISHSSVRDIRPFVFTRATVLVNLWHGIPLKRIALDDNVSEVRNKRFCRYLQWLSQLLCPGFRRQADMFTAASAEDQRNFATAFNFPIERIKITGYPRNDVIFNRGADQHGSVAVKKGIYVPTFRGKENSSFDFFDQFGFDVKAVDSFLATKNTHLYLKLHHFNFPTQPIQGLINAAENIFFYAHDDIYEELASFDFLITDFSSIYFDFLLAQRPIIFAPFDMAGFAGNVRQLYYDYAEVTPGPKAHNWPEVLQCIEGVINNPDAYSAELKTVRDRFHCYRDADSCQRVYAEVMTLV